MPLSRRKLLSVAAAAVPTMPGCLAGGSNVTYPSETPRQGEHSPTRVDAGDAEGEVPLESTPNPDLASHVDRIYDEVVWFARTYPKAIERYLGALRDAEDAVNSVVEMQPFSTSDLDALEESLETVHDRVERVLAPHFRTHKQLRDRAAFHLAVTRRFTRRGDIDRAREQLRRLRRFYADHGTSEFVEASLSRHPIRNRLVWFLRNDPPDEDELPLLTGVRHPESGFAAYVHGGSGWSLLGDPVRQSTREKLDPLDPLVVDRNRIDTLVVAPHEIARTGSPQDPVDPTAPADLSVPAGADSSGAADPVVLVQHYETVAAASAARQSLFEGEITQEGRYTFGDSGGDEWRQVYYPHPGSPDVAYAFLIQAGPYLLVTGASEVSWTERVEWAGPLRRTWLWSP